MNTPNFLEHPIASWQTVAQVTVEPKILRDGWLTYLRRSDHGVIHAENGAEAIYEFAHRHDAVAAGRWFAEKYGAILFLRDDPVAKVQAIARECGGDLTINGAAFSADAWESFCTQMARGR